MLEAVGNKNLEFTGRESQRLSRRADQTALWAYAWVHKTQPAVWYSRGGNTKVKHPLKGKKDPLSPLYGEVVSLGHVLTLYECLLFIDKTDDYIKMLQKVFVVASFFMFLRIFWRCFSFGNRTTCDQNWIVHFQKFGLTALAVRSHMWDHYFCAAWSMVPHMVFTMYSGTT